MKWLETNTQSLCIDEDRDTPERYWNGLIDDVRTCSYAEIEHDPDITDAGDLWIPEVPLPLSMTGSQP